MHKIIQKNFIDQDGKIKAVELRQSVKRELDQLYDKANYLVSGPYKQFWELLHHHLIQIDDLKEKEQYLEIEAQIVTLPVFIKTWNRTAVETVESFEMFVMTKASEIHSGSKDGDYYWALSIRHDQLLGMIRVLQSLVAEMERWVVMKPKEVINDGVFWGMSQYNIDRQIYLEAEKVHQERSANGKDTS